MTTVRVEKAASTTTTVGAGPFTYTGNVQVGGSGTVTGAGGLSAAATSVTYSASPDGTWQVADDGSSYVGYRVREQLASLGSPNEAVGRSTAVTGTMEVAGDTVEAVRIEADPTCPDLPVEARARTYTASIASANPDNTNLEVQFGGASLYVDGLNSFQAAVSGDRFVLRLHGSWVNQAFMEEAAPNTYVGFNGTAAATVPPGVSTIAAVFDGSITHCRTSVRLNEPFYQCVDTWAGPAAPQPETFVACQSKNHRMVFTRR